MDTNEPSAVTATEPREAFGVRGIPALLKAAENAALQTLREAAKHRPKLLVDVR